MNASTPSLPHARALSLWDCVGIGINGIVGSGIYLLIAPMAKVAGYASVVGTFACGLLCILIALCFAELGGMFDRNGGAYLYARAAFGPHVGFAVGWMSMATGVLAFAAVAAGFADALGKVLPLSGQLVSIGSLSVTWKTVVAVGLIAGLGAINYLGVKAGARTSDLLSALKLLPLLLLAGMGLFFLRLEVFSGLFSTASIPSESTSTSYLGALASSAFLAVFMISGFEYTVVPAGEAKDARKNIPLALVGSLLGATLLYCVLQAVALSVLPDLHLHEQPLVDVARAMLGRGGVVLLTVASLVSMAGFCAGSALVGPRYFTALADDGFLPRRLAGQSRFGTPGAATLVSTLLAAGLAVFLGYGSLVDVSNVALFAQYIPASLAVLVLRWRMPNQPRQYRLPGGPIIPLAATGISVALLVMAQPKAAEWIFAAEILAVGAGVWVLTWMAKRTENLAKVGSPFR